LGAYPYFKPLSISKNDQAYAITLTCRKKFLWPAALFICLYAQGQTGPGGVGNTVGTSSLKLWYRVDNGVSVTGTTVDSWTNSAGITALDISETGANRPDLVATGPVNGYNEISFSGSNRLVTDIGDITTSNFVTNQASTFVVCRADNTTQNSCVYTTDPLENAPNTRFSNHIPWSNTVYYDIGTCCDDRIQVGGLSGLTNYNVWSYDAINTATGKQLYQNGSLVSSVAVAALTYSDHASHRFNIGGNTSNGEAQGFVGDVTEVIIYTTKINTAQRRIIQNYLSAKYGIALSADDLYTRDNAGNGNYDHDVAGIGRVDASNQQTDSRGTGIVRVLNASSLSDGDYYFWGHDNGALQAQTSDVPAGVQGRLSRIWRGQEVGTITDFDIEFDLTNLGTVNAAHLRLLIDTDNDASFSDETVGGGGIILGAVDQGSNSYRFENVSGLVTGGSNTRRFTLGTVNITQTPLPITLLNFTASVDENNDVKLSWQTAQEINNDFFTIERSPTGFAWKALKTVPGNGNSKTVLTYAEYDENPFWGISYYRLKQTDFNGASTYSKVVSVVVNKTFRDIVIYPVPAKEELLIECPSSEKFIFQLSDELGREYNIHPVAHQRGISIPTSTLLPGIYFLYITNGQEHCYKRVVIQ
jgi:hypothetical protein